MSLLSTLAKGAIGAFVGEKFGGVSSGGGEVNIANRLSKQVGCQITQAAAPQARALLAKGIDPCSGAPLGGGGGGTTIFDVPGVLTGRIPGSSPIPVFDTPVVGPGGVSSSAGVLQGGSSLEFTRTGLIRNVIVNGRRISRRNASAFIRKAGMEVGSRGLGLSLQQAAQVVLQQSTRPRRRRGISGAQITQAKRVIRTINSMSKALSCTTRRAPVRRKTPCR